jgi:hypothetical protein
MTLMRYVLVPFLALALTTSGRNLHGQEAIVVRSENRIDFERFVALSEIVNLDESNTTELLTFEVVPIFRTTGLDRKSS